MKIVGYLRRIDFEYVRAAAALKHDIVSSCRCYVIEETEYDNWNGGTTGHDVVLFVSEDILRRVPLAEQRKIADDIRSDLNECANNIQNEFVSAVRLDLNDENDKHFQGAKSVSERPQTDPDTLSIWRPGLIRLFISHRDEHKRKAFELAKALEAFGISSFVAHDQIEATKEWRREILNGLETMEAMLVFLTDNFQESPFTNQEVGYALGRGVPIISLKLEGRDPPGFINHEQALRGSLVDPTASALNVQKLVAKKLDRQDRIQSGLISAFLASPDFTETKHRFDRMNSAVKKLSDDEVSAVIAGFRTNSQLFNAGHLTSNYERLKRFLERTTAKQFVIDGRKISERKKRIGQFEDVPF